VRPRPSRGPLTALADASLRVRVMATAALLVTVTSVVTGGLGTVLLRQYLLSRADRKIDTLSAQAGRLLSQAHADRTAPAAPQLPTDFLIEIIGSDGRVQLLLGSRPDEPLPNIPAARLGATAVFTVGGPGHQWRAEVRTLPGGRHAVAAFDLGSIDSTIGHMELADALAGAAAIAALACVGLPLVRISLAPLGRIEKTAEAIAAGDLSRRIIRPRERTEVGRLAAALNTMLGRIEAAYRVREEGEARAVSSEDRMRRFVGDASHELRTPLTAIVGLSELYLQQGGAPTQADVTRMMTGIHAEADRIRLLVDDLLLLAEFDQARPLDSRPVDLASIAAEAVQAARAARRDRVVTLAASGLVIVDADQARLRQVIDTLIGNAFQHTPAGTPVTVTVDAGLCHGQLAVTDQGPGMTAEQAARAFERFYRADPARSRAGGGTGLGLSIVAALVTAHRGTVAVETEPGKGATFIVRLPLTTG
jgi:signal transduction histidine kinase